MKLAIALLLLTQNFSQRGSVESSATVYPQAAVNDSSHVIDDVLLREETFYKPRKDFQISGGVELRTDTHHMVERSVHNVWEDRGLQRPLLSVRRLSASYHRAGFHIEAGKQFIRWGRADILNPTGRFAPRDFLTVVDKEFLAVTAVRANLAHGADTIDAVWAPRFTPSRVPLAGQRWLVVPAGKVLPSLQFQIPDGAQTGIRWSHVGRVEFSTAYYRGFNDIPSTTLSYSRLQMAGGDAALPLRWLTIKSEAGYFDFSDNRGDDYFQYVVQLERQSGEWFFVGGYAGEIITQHGTQSANFNPDRGMTRSILGRTSYTIDASRSIAMEAAIRQNGKGLWIKGEFSQAFGQHWRLTCALSLIRGKESDFLGQYRRNSHGLIAVKYSF